MINAKAMKSLFKPKQNDDNKLNFQDYLLSTGMFTMKEIRKIQLEDECSKSIDESCINTECQHNLLKLHKDEVYIEVLQEFQAERKEVEERTKRDMQKYHGTSFGDSNG